jgi:ATP-dependent Lon protease
MGKQVEFLNFMKLMSGVSPSELADQIAGILDIQTRFKQDLLEQLDVKKRLEKIVTYMANELQILDIEKSIASKTQKKFDDNMRETVLRERLHTIQKELGEIEDDEDQEVDSLRDRIKKAGLPKDAGAKVLKELRRYQQMSVNNPESGYIRTWLDTVLDLPWKKRSRESLSLKKAENILNIDHYGLKDVKERILEYLAVLKLKGATKSESRKKHPTIICFAGPPGVGKTSIGRSIARALNREFVKISLGGIRDEAEIRGHRRTYVGALPGRIIQGMKQAGTKNPVFMLDEIDKVGNDFRGDPSAALLEALDPEQNHEFSDHYLDLAFDLSEVMFVTTANVLHTIPPALLDRLEIIEFTGYTDDEKFHIAREHLFDKVGENNGLTKEQIQLSDSLLKYVIEGYTKEAGVRGLERELGKIARKLARTMIEKKKNVVLTKDLLEKYLGPVKYTKALAEAHDEVGLATGMAWTSVGGDVLFIEVAVMEGKNEIILTGKLGKVMQESARAALTFVRSHAKELGINIKKLDKSAVHIHVPEGAVPKDGPSAGITMTVALVSAFTGRKVRKNVSMTGEVTLRGRVLEIGGLKEKVIAAYRAGITDIIVPAKNEKDLVDVPDEVKKHVKFHFVKEMADVLKVALVGERV